MVLNNHGYCPPIDGGSKQYVIQEFDGYVRLDKSEPMRQSESAYLNVVNL
jgi:hypothetical protein